jgi:hypothetical protein
LYHRQANLPDKVNLAEMIFAERYGNRAFNIDVTERTPASTPCFQGRLRHQGKPESVANLVNRYKDIEDNFPSEEIPEKTLPYFADWLIEKVQLVEITAFSEEDAYTIFETMNDRGLSLAPLDMLKGFLLANISDERQKIEASKTWNQRIAALRELGKEEDSDAFKAWLRSQYAKTTRERKKGALPGDFDRLGTEFHRWVRENKDDVSLNQPDDFLRFIQRDMDFYARRFLEVREASFSMTKGLEPVFCNASHEFTLQYPLLLAPLLPSDDSETIRRKICVVATFIDILLARRLWNFRLIAYSTMQYAMFNVMKSVRQLPLDSLVATLSGRLADETEDFSTNEGFYLHQQNRKAIHRLLARLTDYVETQSGEASRYEEYISEGGNRYEIEHIWADHSERHQAEFPNASDFDAYRNRIGGLLLLPKSFNASYNDLPYEPKLEHYYAQNLLARSLNVKAYDHNPGFLRFIESSKLPFKPHPEFKKADLDARQELYRKIAEKL